jgi:methionyl-tRNA formyltransferase
MPQDGKIDWSKNAEAVLRLVNASSEPFAGAFAEYENVKIIIWRAKLEVDSEVFVAVNGQVLKIGQDYIVVSCKNSKLRITEVGYKGVRGNPSKIIRSIRKRLL